MMSDETKEKLIEYAKDHGLEIFFMCAGIGEGVRELAEHIAVKLKDLPPLKIYESEMDISDLVAEVDAKLDINKN
jgi:hypothetical protein